LNGSEIRRRFLEYFARRDHLVVDSSSLVPADDPTTLFNSAGVQPLEPFYNRVKEPPAPRMVTCQKCLRTDDLEEVGHTDRHCTFFEMLGNFAPTGAYFKETAIPLAWGFLTDPGAGLGLPRDRLRVTVHPTDDEARRLWREMTDVNPRWVVDNEDNWWQLASGLGPCGPDSEIWWDRGEAFGEVADDTNPEDSDRFVEIWNLVFPQFNGRPDGTRIPLAAPGIDTGMGLERIAAVCQGVHSIFETDLYTPLMDFVRTGSERYVEFSARVLSDHLRAMTFVSADGVRPSNEGRGYVLRRLIRRAALHARRVGLRAPLTDGVDLVVELMHDQYPQLAERAGDVRAQIAAEVAAFDRTLGRGLDQFERVVAASERRIPGEDAFRLHDTFGFPIELTRELAEERGLAVDQEGFDAAMAAQRERSRRIVSHSWTDVASLPRAAFVGYDALAADATVAGLRRGGAPVDEAVEGDDVEVYLDRTPFYAESGGQIGDAGTITGPDGTVQVEDTKRPFEGVVVHLGRVVVGRVRAGDTVRAAVDEPRRRQIARHHTATHVLNKALEELLGARNLQRGSWVGPDHTTFDFPLDRALTAEELRRLEGRMWEQVRAALPLSVRVLPYEEAVATGATHLFDEKYGDSVRVVCFGGWSCEFCGGTHSPTTADVGPLVIASEQSVGQGLRRIDLVAGEAAERLLRRRWDTVHDLGRSLGVRAEGVEDRVAALRRELRDAERLVDRLRDEVRQAHVQGGGGRTEDRRRAGTRVPVILERVPAEGMEDLRSWADRYLESLGGSGVVGVATDSIFVLKVSRNLAGRDGGKVDATRLVPLLGRGGGKPELVQGRLTRPPDEAFDALQEALR
jgi:alanyl-tRNA synthetase